MRGLPDEENNFDNIYNRFDTLSAMEGQREIDGRTEVLCHYRASIIIIIIIIMWQRYQVSTFTNYA